MSKSAIRKRVFTGGSPDLNRELGELARDASNAFGALVLLAAAEFTANYTEPLIVGFDHEPTCGVLAVRVREDANPEKVVAGNARTAFVWDRKAMQLRVSVDGCTVGVRYRFNFLMVG